MRTRALSLVPSALFLTALIAAPGCRKPAADPPPETPESTVTEENENGTVAWT